MNKELPGALRRPDFTPDNCMGLIRYFLSIGVIVAHFNIIFGTSYYFPISSFNAVGAFFSLSGFLVLHSYLKFPSVKNFLKGRARRILPPYCFIVLLCAFSFSALSSLNLYDYFTAPQFYQYLVANLTFLNFLQPDLPGVFSHSPETAVNASLWTLKIEWTMYLSIPLFVVLAVWLVRKKGRGWPNILIIAIYLFSLAYRIFFLRLYDQTDNGLFEILSRQFLGQFMYFYSGVLIYFNFGLILKWRLPIILSSALITLIGIWIPYYSITIGPFILSLLTLSVCSIPGVLKVFNRNNISYEMYLFHFPVIQVIYYFFGQNNPQFTFILSLCSIIALSAFCWFVIDRRFLPKKFI
ncbi:MAG: acyltransferase [Muribaculaceae bacterium]|nr:acyltransferase [Muribaculaceae bacterium]